MVNIVKLNFSKITLFWGLSIFLLFTHESTFCQKTNDLDKKKQENIKQLSLAKSLLEKTARSKNYSMNELNLIQQNIELRTDIIFIRFLILKR